MADSIIAPKYSPHSVKSTLAEPGRAVLSSADAGWSSVLLQVVRSPALMEPFETTATPDQLIVLVLEGLYDIESTSSRSSSKARYSPGHGGMTAALSTSRLRWSSETHKTLKTLHLYIPQMYFEEAAEEYRRVSQSTHATFPDVLGFADPIVFSIAQSLAQGARDGAPDLYADADARFLASHLLLKASGLHDARRRENHELTDRRLMRALDFMRQHFTEPVTVSQLAREAAVSQFHFVRLFKAKWESFQTVTSFSSEWNTRETCWSGVTHPFLRSQPHAVMSMLVISLQRLRNITRELPLHSEPQPSPSNSWLAWNSSSDGVNR